MTPVGIGLATFRFVAQHLNHCATAVSPIGHKVSYLYETEVKTEFSLTYRNFQFN